MFQQKAQTLQTLFCSIPSVAQATGRVLAGLFLVASLGLLAACGGSSGGGGGGGGGGGDSPEPSYWTVRLTNAAQAPATLTATPIAYVSPPAALTAGTGGVDDTIVVPAATGATPGQLTLQIPCTVAAFSITGGAESIPAATPRPAAASPTSDPVADCTAASNASPSAPLAAADVAVAPQYWQLTLTNSTRGDYTVEISAAASPALRDFSASPYVEAPTIGGSAVVESGNGANYDSSSGLITLSDGQSFVAKLLCGEGFAITAGGDAPAATLSQRNDACADAAAVVYLPPYWTLTLTNSSQAPATLTATPIAYVSPPAALTAGTGGVDDTIVVPAATGATPGQLTLQIPCATAAFSITGGVEGAPPAATSRPAAASPTSDPVADCTAASNASPSAPLAAADVAVAPQYWQLTLTNSTRGDYTVEISAAASPALRDFSASPYVEAPTIGESAVVESGNGANYDSSSGLITLSDGQSFVAKLLCGVRFDITGGGDASADMVSQRDNTCADAAAVVYTPEAPHWRLTLANSSQAPATLTAAQIAYVNPPPAVTPGQNAEDDTIIVAAAGEVTLKIPCATTGFTITGGAESIPGASQRPRAATPTQDALAECTSASPVLAAADVAVAPQYWQLTLSHSVSGNYTVEISESSPALRDFSASPYVEAPTIGDSAVGANYDAGTGIMTLGNGQSFVAKLLCGVGFVTSADGGGTTRTTRTVTTADVGDCGNNSVTYEPQTDPVWQLTLSNPTQVPVELQATRITYVSPPTSGDSRVAAGNPNDTLIVAAGGSLTLNVPCGTDFRVVAGGDALESGNAAANRDSPGGCSGVTNTPSGGAVVLGRAYWQLTLSHSVSGDYTVEISGSSPNQRDFSASPYVEAPTIGDSAVGANYDAGTGIMTLGNGQSFVAKLLCGVGFVTSADGGGTTRTTRTVTTADVGDCGNNSVTYEPQTDPVWQLTLSNPTQVPVELQATRITYASPPTSGDSRVAAGNPNDTLIVAAGGSLTLNVPCGTDFRVVAGGDALESGNAAANRDSPGGCSGVTNTPSSGAVVLGRAYWQLTLSHSVSGNYTVEISESSPALRDFSASPYVVAPTIGGSAVGANYDAGTGVMTLGNGQSFVARLLCGVDFVTTADGSGTTRATRTVTTADVGDCGNNSMTYEPQTEWQLTLSNPTQVPVQIQATRITYVSPPTSGDSRVAAGNPNDTLIVAAGGSLTLNVPCGTDFRVVAGGDALESGNAAANRDSPGGCSGVTNTPSGGAVVLGRAYWQLTLLHSTAGSYTLLISDAPPALRIFTASPYVEPPQIGAPGALAAVTPSNYSAGIITLGNGQIFVARLLCGMDFVTTADGSGTTRATRTTTTSNDSNCGNNVFAYTPLVTPVWQLTLSNPTQVPVELQATRITYASPPTSGDSRVAAGNPNDTLIVAAGGSLTLNVPCGTDFRVVSGGDALESGNAAANRDSPGGCSGVTNTPSGGAVVLERAYWQLTLTNSTGIPYTVEISAAPPALRTLSASPYVELPQIGDSDVVTSGGTPNYNPTSGIITLADGQSFVAKLLCGEGFAITGGGYAAAQAIAQKATPPCGDADTVTYTPSDVPVWQLTLSNPTQVPVELQATHIDYVNPPSGVTAGTPDTLRVAAAVSGTPGSLTLNVPCGTDFRVVSGGDALESGNAAANRDSPGGCSGVTNTPSGGAVVLGRAYWQLTLTNSTGVPYTVEISAAASPALRDFSASPYVVAPTIGGSAVGANYDAGTGVMTLENGQSFVAKLLCGVRFDITGGGAAAALIIAQKATPPCGDADTVTYTPSDVPVWQLTLTNPTQVPVEIRATSITYVTPTTTGPSRVTASNPNDTLIVAAGGSLTLNVPCGTDFRVAAGGNALEAGNAAANRDAPSTCEGTTNAPQAGGDVVLERAYWQLTLTNSTGIPYTVEISAAPPALRTLSASPYVELPQIGDSDVVTSGGTPNYNPTSGIITLADGQSFVAKLLCGEGFAITGGGYAAAQAIAQKATPPCGDADTVTYTPSDVPVWQLTLTNPTQVPVEIRATSITYVTPTTTGTSRVTASNSNDTLTVAAGGSLTLNVPCGTDFRVVSGGDALESGNAAANRDSPGGCSGVTNTPSGGAVVLGRAYWQLTLSHSASGDYTVEISESSPALRDFSASPYVEAPTIGDSVVGANYDAGTGVMTLENGQSFVAKLLCGVDFVTTADGGGTTRTTRTVTTEDVGDCGNNSVTYTQPVWQLTLSNPSQAPAALTARQIAYVNPPAAVTPGQNAEDDTIIVPAAGEVMLQIPCATTGFTITGGAERPRPRTTPRPVAETPTADPVADCASASPVLAADTLQVVPAHWQLTLANSTGNDYTVEISAAANPALRDFSTSPYVEAPTIGDSAVGANYDTGTGIMTLENGQSFVAKLLCGVDFIITAGGNAPAAMLSQRGRGCADPPLVAYTGPAPANPYTLTLTNTSGTLVDWKADLQVNLRTSGSGSFTELFTLEDGAPATQIYLSCDDAYDLHIVDAADAQKQTLIYYYQQPECTAYVLSLDGQEPLGEKVVREGQDPGPSFLLLLTQNYDEAQSITSLAWRASGTSDSFASFGAGTGRAGILDTGATERALLTPATTPACSNSGGASIDVRATFSGGSMQEISGVPTTCKTSVFWIASAATALPENGYTLTLENAARGWSADLQVELRTDGGAWVAQFGGNPIADGGTPQSLTLLCSTADVPKAYDLRISQSASRQAVLYDLENLGGCQSRSVKLDRYKPAADAFRLRVANTAAMAIASVKWRENGSGSAFAALQAEDSTVLAPVGGAKTETANFLETDAPGCDSSGSGANIDLRTTFLNGSTLDFADIDRKCGRFATWYVSSDGATAAEAGSAYTLTFQNAADGWATPLAVALHIPGGRWEELFTVADGASETYTLLCDTRYDLRLTGEDGKQARLLGLQDGCADTDLALDDYQPADDAFTLRVINTDASEGISAVRWRAAGGAPDYASMISSGGRVFSPLAADSSETAEFTRTDLPACDNGSSLIYLQASFGDGSSQTFDSVNRKCARAIYWHVSSEGAVPPRADVPGDYQARLTNESGRWSGDLAVAAGIRSRHNGFKVAYRGFHFLYNVRDGRRKNFEEELSCGDRFDMRITAEDGAQALVYNHPQPAECATARDEDPALLSPVILDDFEPDRAGRSVPVFLRNDDSTLDIVSIKWREHDLDNPSARYTNVNLRYGRPREGLAAGAEAKLDLPCGESGSYDLRVEFGDGRTQAIKGIPKSCTAVVYWYATPEPPGSYIITLHNAAGRWARPMLVYITIPQLRPGDEVSWNQISSGHGLVEDSFGEVRVFCDQVTHLRFQTANLNFVLSNAVFYNLAGLAGGCQDATVTVDDFQPPNSLETPIHTEYALKIYNRGTAALTALQGKPFEIAGDAAFADVVDKDGTGFASLAVDGEATLRFRDSAPSTPRCTSFSDSTFDELRITHGEEVQSLSKILVKCGRAGHWFVRP